MDISKWFYRPHYTTPELDKKIEDVEKALGFKLFIWQKTYIEYGVFRQYGETTAKILRLLITPGKIVDFTERPRGDKELGLMQPLHPEETPNYSFSDLQLTIYREIILKSEE